MIIVSFEASVDKNYKIVFIVHYMTERHILGGVK